VKLNIGIGQYRPLNIGYRNIGINFHIGTSLYHQGALAFNELRIPKDYSKFQIELIQSPIGN
jgi:hypothetical protein